MIDKRYYLYGSLIFLELVRKGNTTVFQAITDYGFEKLFEDKIDLTSVFKETIEEITKGVKKSDFNAILHGVKYLIALDDSITYEDFLDSSKTYQKKSLCGEEGEVLMFITRTPHSHRNHANENISTLFHNIYFVLKRNKNVSVNNYYISCDYPNSELNLCVDLIPYPINNKIKQKESFDKVYFEERKKDETDELFLKRVEKSLDTITFLVPHIVVTPEIVGCRELDDELSELFKKTGKACCLLCPSYHHVEKNDRFNSSLVLVNENRTNKKTVLYKYRGMDKSNGQKEDINSEYGINIIVINVQNFGRVVFIICRDFLTNDYIQIINDICPEVIIIQSYTNHYSEFINKFGQVVENDCVVYLLNACNAVRETRNKQVVLLEARRPDTYDTNTIKAEFCCKECIGKCHQFDECRFEAVIMIDNNFGKTRLKTNIKEVGHEQAK